MHKPPCLILKPTWGGRLLRRMPMVSSSSVRSWAWLGWPEASSTISTRSAVRAAAITWRPRPFPSEAPLRDKGEREREKERERNIYGEMNIKEKERWKKKEKVVRNKWKRIKWKKGILARWIYPNDTREIQYLNFCTVVIKQTRHTRQCSECIRCNTRLCICKFIKERRFSNWRESY